LLALAAVPTAIVGTILGLPTLRLRGDNIGSVALAFGEIAHGPRVANGQSIQLFARRRWFALLQTAHTVSARPLRAAVKELT
jgi:hypothetical protein